MAAVRDVDDRIMPARILIAQHEAGEHVFDPSDSCPDCRMNVELRNVGTELVELGERAFGEAWPERGWIAQMVARSFAW